MVFRFSASNLIFNLQKNTIPVLAAHFPVTDDSELLIDHFTLCTSFLCLVGKKNKFLPHFITKHLPAHWRWNTMCSSVNNADPGSHPPWQRSTDIKQANSLVFQPLLLFFFFLSDHMEKTKCPGNMYFEKSSAICLTMKQLGSCLQIKNFFSFFLNKITGLDRCFHSSPPWNQLL